MSHRADPSFVAELKHYGAAAVESCFNCGNCTAVCPLSTGDDSFPRRMIRYAQLGMRERVLGSRELWMCYSCGECTATCPRQADPAEFMAAARRFAISRYDRTGLASLMYRSRAFAVSFMIALALALAALLYSAHGPMALDALRLFDFLPYEVIHDAGIAAGIVIGLYALSGIAAMGMRLGRGAFNHGEGHAGWATALWRAVVVEALLHKRYRRECDADAQPRSWYARKWFIHAATLWGFLGLFLATVLDYVLALTGVKPVGAEVPIWYPVRMLGTAAGVSLVYGASAAMIQRLRKADVTYLHSTLSDWSFLILLWLGGMTGFALELALYLPGTHAWSYWMLLAHLVVVAELLILWPVTKFAHALYRPVALVVSALKPLGETEPAGAGEKT